MFRILKPLLQVLLLSALASSLAHAGQARIAVASNFAAPMKALADQFEQATGHTLLLSTGDRQILCANQARRALRRAAGGR
jgi:molybdate transport system substrate-binding protein